MNLFRKISEAVRKYDDAYNFTCDICGREVFENERVCAPCKKALPWNNAHFCPFCGRKVGEAGACLECKQKPLGVEKARSAFTHEGEAMRLVLRFKRGEKYLYRTLTELSVSVFEREFPDADAVTFVPMTEKSQKKRGYNQSRLLAEEFARRSGKVFLDAVVKKRETSAQKTLGREEREKNLEGCFSVTDKSAVKGKRVVILDDTLTTGATVSELAAALKKAGAKTVYAFTFTSVTHKNPFGKPPESKIYRK